MAAKDDYPADHPAFSRKDLKLPAVLQGESTEDFNEKYGKYINPVSDRAKYKHIKGKECIRLYVDGVFDMFHFGHARYILQAKNMFPECWVIAGVASGAATNELKGQTVMSEAERCESVRQCRYVDEVICPAPWVVTEDFLSKNRIDFVVQNGAPYPMGDIADIYAPLKEAGRFLNVQRTEEVSTSDYITRIIHEYDTFLQRNLDRGYSREELGITYMKEKRLGVRRQIEGVQSMISGYIAGFMDYFYEPISHRIVNFISPTNSPHESDYSDDEGATDAPASSKTEVRELPPGPC